MGSGTIREVRDGSGDLLGGPGWFGEPSRRSEMGRRTLREVCDASGHPRRGPGRVGGPSGRSETGRGTLGEDRHWSMVP